MSINTASSSNILGYQSSNLRAWSSLAEGGNITFSGNIITHTYTTTGSLTFTVLNGLPLIEVRMWGGGGSGGSVGNIHAVGGGGGAGAYFTNQVRRESYSLTVGAGGASSGGAGVNRDGNNGLNSVAFGVTCGGGQAGSNNGDGTAAWNPVGGTVSGTPSNGSFIATESGQGQVYSQAAGTIAGAAGGTNWSSTITAFGGGAGRPQGNGSSVFGAAGNIPGGGASSTYGGNDPSYAGARGEIRISYSLG